MTTPVSKAVPMTLPTPQAAPKTGPAPALAATPAAQGDTLKLNAPAPKAANPEVKTHLTLAEYAYKAGDADQGFESYLKAVFAATTLPQTLEVAAAGKAMLYRNQGVFLASHALLKAKVLAKNKEEATWVRQTAERMGAGVAATAAKEAELTLPSDPEHTLAPKPKPGFFKKMFGKK